jgi:hypothetical protein
MGKLSMIPEKRTEKALSRLRSSITNRDSELDLPSVWKILPPPENLKISDGLLVVPAIRIKERRDRFSVQILLHSGAN